MRNFENYATPIMLLIFLQDICDEGNRLIILIIIILTENFSVLFQFYCVKGQNSS